MRKTRQRRALTGIRLGRRRPQSYGARPHVGAITLALLFGLFNLIFGIWMGVQGTELRRTGKTRRIGSLMRPVPARPGEHR